MLLKQCPQEYKYTEMLLCIIITLVTELKLLVCKPKNPRFSNLRKGRFLAWLFHPLPHSLSSLSQYNVGSLGTSYQFPSSLLGDYEDFIPEPFDEKEIYPSWRLCRLCSSSMLHNMEKKWLAVHSVPLPQGMLTLCWQAWLWFNPEFNHPKRKGQCVWMGSIC